MKNGLFIDKDYFEKYKIKQNKLYKSDFDLLLEQVQYRSDNDDN